MYEARPKAIASVPCVRTLEDLRQSARTALPPPGGGLGPTPLAPQTYATAKNACQAQKRMAHDLAEIRGGSSPRSDFYIIHFLDFPGLLENVAMCGHTFFLGRWVAK